MIRHLAHCEKAALLTVYKFGNYNGLDKIFRILRGSGKRMKSTRFWISCVALSTLLLGLSVAQDNSNTKNSKGAKAAPAKETVAKPLSEKEKKRREAKLRKELGLAAFLFLLAEGLGYRFFRRSGLSAFGIFCVAIVLSD